MDDDTLFFNAPVPLDSLPQASAVPGLPLHRSYLRLRLISDSLFFLILLIGMLVTFSQLPLSPGTMAVFASGWALLYAATLTNIVRGHRFKSYALRERDILYRSGWIWRSETVIPFNRVQHCEVSQGPIEKRLGLATLKVFTAGGQSADLAIPGIGHEAANKLKDYLIKRTGADVAN